MRISLLSDTHQNFRDSNVWPYPLPDHDILVLAGDISEYVDGPANLTEVLAHYRSRTDRPSFICREITSFIAMTTTRHWTGSAAIPLNWASNC